MKPISGKHSLTLNPKPYICLTYETHLRHTFTKP
jgi:hypothetical protein